MKYLLPAFILLHTVALAASVEKLSDFVLTDQDSKKRSYRFPKEKVTVMTIADHKGSDQLTPWIKSMHDRYGKRIDIDGVADVSMIPGPFQGMFREAFRKKLTYSVMLDWGGAVVKEFGYTKGVANIYVIDRDGRIVKHAIGSFDAATARELFTIIDSADSTPSSK